jgi:O-antigen/teichoic acid export membrane protein
VSESKDNGIMKLESKNVIVYLLSDVLVKGIPFLLIPIYTLYLTPTQFGNISIFNIIVEVMIIFVVMGGNSYYRVQFFKIENSNSLLGAVVSNFVYTIPLALLLMIIFMFFDLNPSKHETYWLFIGFVIAISQSVILLAVACFQCKGKALYVGTINIVSAIVSGLVTVGLLMSGYEEESRYIAYFIASFIVMFLSIYMYKSTEKQWPEIAKEHSIPAIKFGLGVLPHALSWWARTGMDRLIIAKFVSIHQVGLYSIAAQLSLVVIVLSNAVNQAFTPKIMKMLTENRFKKTLTFCFHVILGYLIICILIALLAPLIFKLFIDNKFIDAQVLLPMMCAVAFFQAVVTLFSNFLYFFKRVKLLSAVTFFSSLLHVFIAFAAVHSYGVNGVILSSVVTYIMSAILIVGLSIQSIRKVNNA